MKLTKENIYINLIGKSEDELTELYWLLSNNNEVIFRSFERFLEYPFDIDSHIGFCELYNHWGSGVNLGNREEVTIEQLKEILKMTRNQELIEEAKRRGYTHNNFKCLNKSYNRTSIESLDKWYYNELEDTLFTNTRMNGGKAVYKNGVWAEIKNNNLTLEQQLEKAEAEVKRLKEAIEEENNIKVGDWVKRNYLGIEIFKADNTHDYRYINSEKSLYQKITNPEFIKLLENEIK